MTAGQPATPSATPIPAAASRQWLAWASLILALIFPLTYGAVVALIIALRVSQGGNPFVEALYTVFDYIEWPLPISAVILGHLALARGGNRRNLARAGLILGYLAICLLLGIILALIVTNGH